MAKYTVAKMIFVQENLLRDGKPFAYIGKIHNYETDSDIRRKAEFIAAALNSYVKN